MAVRFRSEFYSTFNDIAWKVDLLDTTYVGSVTNITTTGEGFDIVYQNQGDERYTPIKGSECKVYAKITADAAGTALQNWLNSSVNAQKEDQFYVIIYKNGAFHWCGVILPDLNTREDLSAPYDHIISATDGLARLKTKPFPPALATVSTYPPIRNTFIELIWEALKLTPFYMATSENLMFSTAVNWYEAGMPSVSSTTDPLAQSEVSPVVYATTNEGEEVVPISTYDALAKICEAWGMRVMLSEGLFRFYQVNIYEDSGATVYERFYLRSTGTLDSAGPFDAYNVTITNDDFPHIKAGNQFQWFAPLQAVYLKQPFTLNNLLSTSDEDMTLSGGVYSYAQDLSDYITGGTNKKLVFNGTLRYYFNNGGFAGNLESTISIKIKIGTYYLSKGALSSVTTWTTNSSDRYEIIWRGPLYGVSRLSITFATPDIPAGTYTSNALSIEVLDLYDTGGTSYVAGTDYVCYRQLGTFSLIPNASTTEENQGYYQIDGYNTAVRINSYDLDLEDSVIGEYPVATYAGHIFVYDGGAWIPSTGVWKLNDTGASYPFNSFRVAEVLSGQTTAIQKYQGSIIGGLEAHYSFDYNSNRFILNGGTYSAQSETFDAEWFSIQVDRADLDVSEPELPTGGGETQLRREIGGAYGLANEAMTYIKKVHFYVETISADTTISGDNGTYSVDTANVTITLAPAADWIYQLFSSEITIKNICGGSSDKAYIAPSGGENIDGSNSTIEISQYHSLTLYSDGTNIWIKGYYKNI